MKGAFPAVRAFVCLAALAAACDADAPFAPALALVADPATVEAGGTTKLKLAGEALVDAGDRTYSWHASGGTIAGRGGGAIWTAPGVIGRYTISVSDERSDAPIASARIMVRRFGPLPPEGCTVRCESIFTGSLRKDQVEALDMPRNVAGAEAIGLDDDALVVLVRAGKGARAYPLNVLAYHEVVNDELGGGKITVSYSPLTGAASVFASGDSGGFGNLGAFYDSDHLLYDRRTNSTWSPLRFECIRGERLGTLLAPIPFVIGKWGAIASLELGATVTWPVAADPTRTDYSRNPYAWYEADDGHIVGPLSYFDLRLPRKQRVIGVWRGGAARAYPYARLGARAVVNDALNGRDLVVAFDAGSGIGAAFDRTIAGRLLSFEMIEAGSLARHMRDLQTGSSWSILGEAVDGPLKGSRLGLLSRYQGFFFAWAAYRQGTEIWR
ncbi:MAG: DUF3179 domain-containing (seleno)protein [Deltaproteobacteria bacterium]|nr:DUF3179 domain-containing (seleno)protein [Deltaproteobacteria bacterium]